jgi:hypothetical protein
MATKAHINSRTTSKTYKSLPAITPLGYCCGSIFQNDKFNKWYVCFLLLDSLIWQVRRINGDAIISATIFILEHFQCSVESDEDLF